MSALLIGNNLSFETLIWGITAIFMSAAILLCAAITIRRAARNKHMRKRQRQKGEYQIFLRDIIRAGPNSYPILKHQPACHIDDKTAVFLHYFRTLKGEKFDTLQALISDSDIEAEIIKTSYHGSRGTRMQAVKTLSYLNSQSSLEKIYGHLSSQDKYIRLTAARCLVRRNGLFSLSAIIEACLDGFPDDYRLLAGILSGFGPAAVTHLEGDVRRLNNSIGIAACLEALVLIMPPKTNLDFRELMSHESAAVRSAAVALSSIAEHSNQIDPLKLGLTDEDISVKIRAAKVACDLNRKDLISEFYALSTSPIMWLRYWSMRAIWASGPSGQKFLDSLSKSHPMAEKVALEMRSGYV
jgi:hypothetical protein